MLEHELYETANHLMRQERDGHTLQATALINEAIVRLLGDTTLENAPNRKYLFGVIVRAMRQTLVDHARKKKSAKQGGDRRHYALDDVIESIEHESRVDLDALETALVELGENNPRQREVVELRFFGGLSAKQPAELLDVSLATVERDWRLARVKLYRNLREIEP